MQALYTFSIFIYGCIIRLAALFNQKAKSWVEGRKDLLNTAPINHNKKLKINWFHCASLGEFEQGRPLIEEFKKKFPEEKILLTFYSPSGYEIRKNYELADWVTYLPLDLKSKMNPFINQINPHRVFIVKYELWFNMLQILRDKKINTYLISGKFRSEQHFFKKKGTWFLDILANSFTHFFVQDETSKKQLQNAGINKVEICGDTRIDRVIKLAQTPLKFNHLETLIINKKVIIAGSTWQKENELLSKIKLTNNTLLIIAPHDVKTENIQQLQKKFPHAVLWTDIEKQNVCPPILIINCIGILSSLYQYAHIAIIGGGYNTGIHNILEPACFGLPVFFGPKHHKFDEAAAMIKNKTGFVLQDALYLEQEIKSLLESEEIRANIRKKQLEYLKTQSGATQKIMEQLF